MSKAIFEVYVGCLFSAFMLGFLILMFPGPILLREHNKIILLVEIVIAAWALVGQMKAIQLQNVQSQESAPSARIDGK